ncbi:MAG TPA: hypothetical protein VMT54_05100 [Candidatus Cybelea sp.]|nr:hypothetical protein [Candidatus Cybelea sp.]
MDVGAASTLSSTTANALQGLKKADNELNEASQNIAGGSQDPKDIVSLSQAATSFKANAAVIKTQDEVTQSLLNIKA